MSDYDFEYTDNGPYGATLRLLHAEELAGRIVLDIGCGSAAIASHVGQSGATYIGVDTDERSIANLSKRGYEAHAVDITDVKLTQTIREILGTRQVAAITCLDVLEHVSDPEAVLGRLTNAVSGNDDVELIVSIPNVAHIDLARSLLCGRWDTTETGLLDRTHLRFFTSDSLTALMSRSGWFESTRDDVRLEHSDQHRAGHPVFSEETNLGMLLADVRNGADTDGTVNQFVRRYHRGAARTYQSTGRDVPFLSVIMRTLGSRNDNLEEALCCLAAQTDLDFEVIIAVHGSEHITDVQRVVDRFESNLAQRVKVRCCDGGFRGRPANLGLSEASGSYIAFLDDDDLVTADWVQRFHEGADAKQGMLIRSWAAEQRRAWASQHELADHYPIGPLTGTYNSHFDLIRHIRQNETPFHCFAFPSSLLELGYEFNEHVSVCEDWEFLVRVASICGVYDTERMTSIYNRWSDNSSAQDIHADEWNVMRAFIHVELDRQPLLLPPGSVRALDTLNERVEQDGRRIAELEAALADTQAKLDAHARVSQNAHVALDELRHSTSWRMSAPVRGVGSAVRRMRDRLGGEH